MKKTIILGLALAATTASYAQSENTSAPKEDVVLSFKSKNDHEVLPQKGDWSLGASATGFLGYLGNLMNGNTGNGVPPFGVANGPSAFSLGNVGGMAFTGKYMVKGDMAYRVRFLANLGSNTYRNNVIKDMATPDPMNPKYVEDNMAVNSAVVLLGAGFEKRRGSGRLQGIYGAEVLLGMSSTKTNYTYGNSFSTDFNAPTSTTDFNFGTSSAVSTRRKEDYSGASLLAGVRGFAGVEYFIAPKMSLGGEIGYTLGFSSNGNGYVTTEMWNTATSNTSTVKTVTTPKSGLRSFGMGLDNVNAGINLNFYF